MMSMRMFALNRLMWPRAFAAGAWALTLCTSVQAGGVISVDVILVSGQSPPGAPKGSTVTTLNAPFTDGNGKVGFTGNLSPSNNFVWYDNEIKWTNADGLPDVLTGAEGTMGVSNTGDFIYAPVVNGNDAVWTANGVLLQETNPAPDFPGMNVIFNSRPTMIADGTGYWIAGIGPATSSTNRVFYKVNPQGVISKVFAGGDVIDGQTLSSTTSNFTYWVADNGNHIHFVTILNPTREAVMVNGAMAHIETNPTGQGANWQNFSACSINNAGNYVFGGDDSGATASDAFVAYNGTIVIREAEVLDGVTLTALAMRWISINNDNRVAFIVGVTGGAEHLFEGDGANLAATAQRILSTGDTVDTDGDTVADATLVDFVASPTISPGLDFSDHRFIHAEVDLVDFATQTEREAIIRIPLPKLDQPCPPDIDDNGTVNVDDLLAVINSWGDCPGCPADVDANGVVNVDDLLAIINSWGDCP